jgi:hypothetical protein
MQSVLPDDLRISFLNRELELVDRRDVSQDLAPIELKERAGTLYWPIVFVRFLSHGPTVPVQAMFSSRTIKLSSFSLH